MCFLRNVSLACTVLAAHMCFSALNFVEDSFEINDGGEAGPVVYYKAETNGSGIVNSPWSPLFQGYSISTGIDTSMFPLNNLRRPMSSCHGLTTNQVLSISPYTKELKRAVVGTFDAQGSLTGSGASCSGGAQVYLDLLTQFGEGMATTPDELTKLQSAQVKAAFFVSTNGNLIVYSLAGFSEIHTMPVNGENWYRLTIEMQTAEIEAISNLLFRVYRDAEPVLSSDALTEALLPGTTENPGVWFKAAVQNDFRVKAVGFDGEGAVDELVVSDTSPNLGTNTTHTVQISTGGAGAGTVEPLGLITVPDGWNKTLTIMPDAESRIQDILLDGLSTGATNTTYTLSNIRSNTLVDVVFTLASAMAFTGRVTNASGQAIPNATIVFKTSTNGLPLAQVLTTSQGYYTYTVNNTTGIYFVCASKTGYRISTNAVVGAGYSLRADFVLAASRNIPKMHYLLFALEGASLGVPDSTANWPLLHSTYPYEALTSMQVMGQPPVVEYLGATYSNNRRSGGDGYRLNRIEAAQGQTIPVEGVTITTLVRPLRNTTSDSWDSVVDFYYDNLRFMIQNSTGQVSVRRNTGQNNTGTIPDGQLTILSLVLQTNGTYEVWSRAYNAANKNFNAATRIGNITAQTPFVAFTPKQSGTEGFKGWINIGRNNPDGWSTFNGYIGDTFVYRTALTATERGELEADIAARVVAALDTIRTVTVTSQGTGTVTPSGAIVVKRGSSQSFTAVPAYGYALTSVTTNAVSVGAVVSPWILENVQTDIALHVTFSALPTRVISGRVTDAAGQPVSGALVQVRAQDGTLTGITTLTDSAGFYSITMPNVEGSLFITREDVGVQVISLVANGSQTHNAIIAVSSGIQCRWNFDSNLLDSVAGRLASYSGAAPLVYSADAKKIALPGGLKGTGAIILPQGAVPTASTNEMTIEIWAKKTALHNGSRIFDFGTSLGNHLAMVWQQGAGEAVGTRYYIAATVNPGAGANGETLFTLYRKNLTTGTTTVASGSSRWTLEALAGANLFIGRSVWDDNDAGAEYDELRIYDRALTQAEMQVNSLAGPDVCPEFPSLTFDCAEGAPRLQPYMFGGEINLNALECKVLNGHVLAPGTYTLMTAPNGTLQGLPTLTGLGGYWKLINVNGALKLVFDPGSILMVL